MTYREQYLVAKDRRNQALVANMHAIDAHLPEPYTAEDIEAMRIDVELAAAAARQTSDAAGKSIGDLIAWALNGRPRHRTQGGVSVRSSSSRSRQSVP